MSRKCCTILLASLSFTSSAFGALPVTAEVVEVTKIWDKAAHNAFTDLIYWNNSLYCVFREGTAHVSTDGKIRVLKSDDGDTWNSAASITLPGYDLRDPHISAMPDGKLMLIGGACPRKRDSEAAPTGTFASFSQDGSQWTDPQIVLDPGRWLWRLTWHRATAYGVSYTHGPGPSCLELLTSTDGLIYKPHVARLFEEGFPNETTLRFDPDGTCYAIVRRDSRHGSPSSAQMGLSRPDYKEWRWFDLGAGFNGFGGPNFIRIPGPHWIGAGRMHQGGAHTALTYIDVSKGTMTKLLKLPGGGDTSYAGLLWHNALLYAGYYSSHEGKTSIYLAKVRISARQQGLTENKTHRVVSRAKGN